MKVKIWKLLSLVLVSIFVLSAVNSVHAQTQISGVGVYPTAVAYDPTTNQIIVVNPTGGSLSVISDINDQVTQTIAMPYTPEALAYDSGQNAMYISTYGGVYILPNNANDVTGPIPGTQGGSGTSIVYDSGMGYIFVDANGVLVIKDSSNTIIANITVPNPGPLVYDSAKNAVYMSEDVGTDVFVISDKTLELNKTPITVASNPFLNPGSLAYDSAKDRIYVTNSTDVSVISDSNNEIVAVVHNVGSALTLVYAGNDEIICSNGAVISDKSNSVTATLNVGTSPSGIAYDSGTGQVFVTNGNDPGTVTYTSVSSGTPSTASPTSSPSSSSTASSTPKVPEFSSAALVLVIVAMIALTVSAVTLKARTKKSLRK
jgi:DNA-binding beta-propeller fold protein YncE